MLQVFSVNVCPVTEPPLPPRHWHLDQSGRSLPSGALGEGLRGQQEVSPCSGAAAVPGISNGNEKVRLSSSLCWQCPAPGQGVPKDMVLLFLGRVVVIRESYRYCMIIIEISVLIAEVLLVKAVTSKRVFDIILPKDTAFAKKDINCSSAHASF